MPIFRDRREAGKRLAKQLPPLQGEHPVVIALPRGGVPVAAEIARRIGAPLDVVVARKIGAPYQPELAIGAVAEGPAAAQATDEPAVTVLNEAIIAELGLSEARVTQLRAEKLRELAERVERYRAGRPRLPVEGRTVILVDDGIATGATVEAAVQALRGLRAKRIVLAVPVAPPDTVARLRRLVDDTICLAEPENFMAIGSFYRDFEQVADAEVARLLARPAAQRSGPAPYDDAEYDDAGAGH